MPDILNNQDARILVGIQPDERDLSRLYNRIGNIGRNVPPIKLRVQNGAALGTMSKSAAEFERSLAAASSRVISFGATASILYSTAAALNSIVKSAISVEKALTDVNVVTQVSAERLSKFSSQLFEVANKTGQSFDVASKAVLEFARQGLSLEESLKRSQDAMILTRFTGLELSDSISTITTVLNSFDNATLNSTKVLEKISAIDLSFAASGKDLATGLTRVGSIAKDAGVEFDKLLALITSARVISGRTGEVVGTGLGTILQRIGRSETREQLAQLGVAVEDLNGNFLSGDKILTNLAQKWDTLTDAQKNNIGQTVGGVRQQNILRALMGDLAKENSIFARATLESANATGIAAQRNEELNKTLAATVNEIRNRFTQLGSSIGNLTIKNPIETFAGAFKDFDNLLKSENPGVKFGLDIGTGILKGLGDYLSGPGAATIVVLAAKLFGNFGRFAAEAVGRILENTSNELRTRQAITNLLATNQSLYQKLNQSGLSQLQIQESILAALKGQSVEFARQGQIVAATKTLAAAGQIKLKNDNFVIAPRTPNTKAVGHIPEITEKIGAYAGGYTPGVVKEMNIPSLGNVFYNTAEKVKKFPGLSQPAIIPPQNSKAGINYQKEFAKAHGFNPYKSEGLIPNYAKKFESPIQLGKLIGAGSYKDIYSVRSIQGDLFDKSLDLDPKSIVAGILKRKNIKDFEKQEQLFKYGAPVPKIYGYADVNAPSGYNRQNLKKKSAALIERVEPFSDNDARYVAQNAGLGHYGDVYKNVSGVLAQYLKEKGYVDSYKKAAGWGGIQGDLTLRNLAVKSGFSKGQALDELSTIAQLDPLSKLGYGDIKYIDSIVSNSGLTVADVGYLNPRKVSKGLIPNYARGERYLSSSQVPINPSSILELLSKDERRVLVKLGEGANLQEISSEMKLPQNAVSTLIENAKKSFTTKYGLAKQGRLNFAEGLVPNYASLIKAAAIRYKDKIFTGSYHGDALVKMGQTLGLGGDVPFPMDYDEGFISRNGKFISREVAAKVSGLKRKVAYSEDYDFHSSSGLIPSFANPKDSLLNYLSQVNPKYVGLFRNIQKQDAGLAKFIRNSADLRNPKAAGEMNKILKKDLLQYTPSKYGLDTTSYVNLQDIPEDIRKSIGKKFNEFDIKSPFENSGLIPSFASSFDTKLLENITKKYKIFGKKLPLKERNQAQIGAALSLSEKVNIPAEKLLQDKYFQDEFRRFVPANKGLVPNYVGNYGLRAAAIKYGGKIYKAPLHYDAFEKVMKEHPDVRKSYLQRRDSSKDGKYDIYGGLETGYVTNDGEFISRQKAKANFGVDFSSQIDFDNYSKGLIPNFASFKSLNAAISRENSAGIPMSQIRVGQSPILKSNLNPAGLGIYNTKDEPLGLNQGIQRVAAMGLDPKKAGTYSEGHVPNFVSPIQFNELKSARERELVTQDFEQLRLSVKSGVLSLKEAFNELEKLGKTSNIAEKSLNNLKQSLILISNRRSPIASTPIPTAFQAALNRNPNLNALTIIPREKQEEIRKGIARNVEDRIINLTRSTKQSRSVFLDENLEKRRVFNLTGPRESDFERNRVRQQARSFRFEEFQGRTYKSGFNLVDEQLLGTRDLSESQKRRVIVRQKQIENIRKRNEELRKSQTLNLPPGTFGPSREQFDIIKRNEKFARQEQATRERPFRQFQRFTESNVSQLSRNDLTQQLRKLTAAGRGLPEELRNEYLKSIREFAKQEISSRELQRLQSSAGRLGGLGSFFGQGRRDFQTLKQRSPEAARDISSSLQNKALIASIAGPVVAGVAQELIGTETRRQRGGGAIAGALGNALGFAGVGATFAGPVGAAVGGAGGFLIQLPNIIKSFSDTLPDLQKRFEELKDVSQQTEVSLGEYINTTEKLSQIYRGELTGLTNKQVKELELGQRNALLGVPNLEDRNKIENLVKSGNLTETRSQIALINQRNAQAVNANALNQTVKTLLPNIKSAQNIREEIEGKQRRALGSSIFYTPGLSKNIKDNTEENILKTIANPKRLKQIENIVSPVEQGALGLLNKQGESLFDTLLKDPNLTKQLTGAKSGEFGKVFGDLVLSLDGFDPEAIGNLVGAFDDLEKKLGPEAAKRFKETFSGAGLQKINEAGKEFVAQQLRISKSISDINAALIQSQREFEKLGTSIQVSGIQRLGELTTNLKVGEIRNQSKNDISLIGRRGEGLQNLLEFNQNRLSISNQSNTQRQELSNRFSEQLFGEKGAVSSAREDLRNSLQQNLEKIFGNDTETVKKRLEETLKQFDSSFKPFIERLDSGENITSQFLDTLGRSTDIQLREAERASLQPNSTTDSKILVETLRKLSEAITNSQGGFRTGRAQINTGEKSSQQINLEQFRANEARIQPLFDEQQKISKFLGGLESSGILRQGRLSRQQLVSRPVEAIGIQRQANLGNAAENLLGQAVSQRSELGDLGLTIDNLDNQLPKLIEQTEKLKSNTSATAEELKIYSDRSRALIDLQTKFNIEKEKQKAIEKESLKNLELELKFVENRVARERELNKNNAQQGNFKEVRENLGNTFTETLSFNTNDFYNQLSKDTADFGEQFKQTFKDGFAEAATGASKFNDVLRNIGISLGKNIVTKASNLATDQLFAALFASGKNNSTSNITGGAGILTGLFKKDGGPIKKYAYGGYVNQGSGVKDDVPALLGGGEFVIKKSSTQKLGKNFLEALNNGGLIKKYASGGFNQIFANEFVGVGDKKRPTSGYANISPLLSDIALNDENNPQNKLRLDREQYFRDLKEYNLQNALILRDFRKQQTARRTSAYISTGINLTGSVAGGLRSNYKNYGQFSNPHNASYLTGKAMGGLIPKRYAAGGSVFGGNDIKDNVPALLMGGEYVFNKDATNRIGKNNLEYMNKTGNLPRFAQGGYVGNSNPVYGGNNDINMMSKYFSEQLTLLTQIRDSFKNPNQNQNINQTNAAPSISISNSFNVQFSDNGARVSSSTQENSKSENDKQTNNQDRAQQAKEMNNVLVGLINQTIAKESKSGGILYNTFVKK